MQNASLLLAKIKAFFHSSNKKPIICYSQQKNIVSNLKKEEKKQDYALRFLKTRHAKPYKGHKHALRTRKFPCSASQWGFPAAGPEATLPAIAPWEAGKKKPACKRPDTPCRIFYKPDICTGISPTYYLRTIFPPSTFMPFSVRL